MKANEFRVTIVGINMFLDSVSNTMWFGHSIITKYQVQKKLNERK